jgi:leader peptidase (prepilin peptidase)/N-methyltransferase
MHDRPTFNWPLASVVVLTLAVAVIYIFGWPVAAMMRELADARALDSAWRVQTPPALRIYLRAYEFVVYAWFFLIGGSIGSFLNVVVYRCPRGLSLLGISQCPKCATQIQARDNIPVLGWLLLRGRCRACNQVISFRYPCVEFTVGIIVLTLALVEICAYGINLPSRVMEPPSGESWVIGQPRWELAALWLYHMTLLISLLGWTLINRDRFPVPASLFAFTAGVGLVVPLLQPLVQPVPWGTQPSLTGVRWHVAGVMATSAAGAAVGAICGCLLGKLGILIDISYGTRRQQLVEGTTAMAIGGLFLGWQAALAVALITLVMRALTLGVSLRSPGVSSLPPMFAVFLAVALQILAWRFLAGPF